MEPRGGKEPKPAKFLIILAPGMLTNLRGRLQPDGPSSLLAVEGPHRIPSAFDSIKHPSTLSNH